MRVLVGLLLWSFSAVAVDGADLEAIRVKSDLTQILGRIVSFDSFVVQAVGDYKRVSEQKLWQQEKSSQTPGTEPRIDIPLLPGFMSNKNFGKEIPASPAKQDRQLYYTAEKDMLRLMMVQVVLDESISAEKTADMKRIVDSYLAINFGKKYSLQLDAVEMRKPEIIPWWRSDFVVPVVLAFSVLFILMLWTLIRVSRTKNEEQKRDIPASTNTNTQNGQEEYREDKSKDARRTVLELFSGNAVAFSAYFKKLTPNARIDLCGQMDGPAFSNFTESLHLEVPKEAQSTALDFDKISFYHKDFSEFLNIFSWQTQQFFGFLKHTPITRLTELVIEEAPLAAACVMYFVSSEQSAHILEHLSNERRTTLLQQIPEVSHLSRAEITKIEKTVRHSLESAGQQGESLAQDEGKFWSDILEEADEPETILADIKQTLPRVFPLLSKYDFRMEDVLVFPVEKIAKVLGTIDNDQLAIGLMGCTPEVQRLLLHSIASNRRGIVTSQMRTFSDLPVEKIIRAKRDLVRSFRKVKNS